MQGVASASSRTPGRRLDAQRARGMSEAAGIACAWAAYRAAQSAGALEIGDVARELRERNAQLGALHTSAEEGGQRLRDLTYRCDIQRPGPR